ncbi:MerC domain-containing protein [Sphingomonas sp. LaA6.9]|uniref:MerC domain-containing protein n=1 Tax=Sphingomonas sp. LaA6.9 TaxID=2919914 RepID=UPI001F503265|nr:MerC domain-containing protein [Sphingomonas sp. LaA6.9]MCJ8156246.1 MerC domain-containing protein [Sphingomonas sp. LaA6.9]
MKRPSRAQRIWDGAAIGASALCLAHCLGLPVLIAMLPALADLLAFPESFHLAAFAFALPASGIALLAGYRRHGLLLPAIMGAVGLLLIGWGATGGHRIAIETGLTVLGSLLLAMGHIWNWRARLAR